VWCSLSSDTELARDELRKKIAYYGPSLSPLILEALDLQKSDFNEIEKNMKLNKDLETAKALVTDKMLNIGIVGDAQELIRRLEKLVRLGVTHLSFGPPLGPDPIEALQILGTEVIPHFK
jgi:5,10-methylenetetrahydromethanopterin reductase